jgi:hypothetical protein
VKQRVRRRSLVKTKKKIKKKYTLLWRSKLRLMK